MSKAPESIDHIEYWRRIVSARREQHDAACAAQHRTTDDYWARRAESFRAFVRLAARGVDPLVASVRKQLRAEDTILDIGAGTGRHAVALAPHAQRVTALDPSPAMLAFLREDAEEASLDNIDVIEGAWPDAAGETPEADIVISANVLYPIEDVVPFLVAMDGHARRLCFLQLMTRQPWFDPPGLWQAVHGEPRRPQPAYMEAVNLLHQLGCYANVEIAWADIPRTFDSLDIAVERFAESVAVGDDEERRARLRAALEETLEIRSDGTLALAGQRFPQATVWWEAGALQEASG